VPLVATTTVALLAAFRLPVFVQLPPVPGPFTLAPVAALFGPLEVCVPAGQV